MKIKGEGIYVDAAGVLHEVKGKSVLSDDVILQSLKVSGKLEFDKISCDNVDIAGKCECDALTAKNISVKGKIDANSIEADEIVVESRSGLIGTVKCGKLKIFGHTSTATEEIFAKFFGSKFFDDDIVTIGNNDSRVQVKSIDAVKVELENCEVGVIRCNDATIGTNCAVGKLFVVGECEISSNSTVGEIIRS